MKLLLNKAVHLQLFSVPGSIENLPRFDPMLARYGSIHWTLIGSEHWLNEVLAVGPTLAFQYWPCVVNKHRPDAFPWMDPHWPDIIYIGSALGLCWHGIKAYTCTYWFDIGYRLALYLYPYILIGLPLGIGWDYIYAYM